MLFTDLRNEILDQFNEVAGELESLKTSIVDNCENVEVGRSFLQVAKSVQKTFIKSHANLCDFETTRLSQEIFAELTDDDYLHDFTTGDTVKAQK